MTPLPVKHRRSQNHRSGMTIIEATTGLVILMVVISSIVAVLSRNSSMRAQIEQHEFAMQAVANLLERAGVSPTPSEDQLRTIGQELLQDGSLTEPEWSIQSEQESTPPLRRTQITLSWKSPPRQNNSVSLVRWYPGGTP